MRLDLGFETVHLRLANLPLGVEQRGEVDLAGLVGRQCRAQAQFRLGQQLCLDQHFGAACAVEGREIARELAQQLVGHGLGARACGTDHGLGLTLLRPACILLQRDVEFDHHAELGQARARLDGLQADQPVGVAVAPGQVPALLRARHPRLLGKHLRIAGPCPLGKARGVGGRQARQRAQRLRIGQRSGAVASQQGVQASLQLTLLVVERDELGTHGGLLELCTDRVLLRDETAGIACLRDLLEA